MLIRSSIDEMQFDYSRISPYVIALLAVLLVYRRFRRSFGRQPVHPIRMRVRIGILLVLGGSLLPMALQGAEFLTAEGAGLLAGVGLGIWAAQRTRYRRYDGRLHYVPHTYTGIAVSLLFIGRLAYRLAELYTMNRSSGSGGMEFASPSFATPAMARSPFTLGVLFVVVGYYVCYYSMVLWKSKRVSPEELEVVETSAAV